jgi:T4 RnlA family RNA ligase
MSKLLQELQKRSDYINEKRHDTLDLIIWNYNNKCAIDEAWDEYTLMARGLITDLKGNIVSRPLKKFFNLNQTEESRIENLPMELPDIYEKLDGSMCVQYYDSDKVCVATRGSFNSDQAIHGTKLLENRLRTDFNAKWTYIYELIAPFNRILVSYGDRDELVLLAVIDTQTGEEGDYIQEAQRLGFSYAQKYYKKLDELVEIVKTLSADEEGFVVKYPNNYRVKIKGVEYLRLHRLITGFSTKSIWECLMNGDSFEEVLTNVPDEFYKWIIEKKEELEKQFLEINIKIDLAYSIVKTLPDRKSQALYILKNWKDISGELFSKLNGKDYNKIIWKKLKPQYELPFIQES